MVIFRFHTLSSLAIRFKHIICHDNSFVQNMRTRSTVAHVHMTLLTQIILHHCADVKNMTAYTCFQ